MLSIIVECIVGLTIGVIIGCIIVAFSGFFLGG